MSNNFQKMLLEKMKANKEKRDLLDKKLEENKKIRESKKTRHRSPSPVSITHDFEKPKKEKKTYKESNIMKARSDLKKKGDKYTVDTEMNVRKGLDKKVKSALKKSVISQLDKSISGSGVEKIVLDYSSSEDEKPKKRGRPKKGKGVHEDESSSDEEDIKEYGKILKHLIGHIKDPKEKIDKNDFKQAIELIKKIKDKKK